MELWDAAPVSKTRYEEKNEKYLIGDLILTTCWNDNFLIDSVE